MRRYLLLGAVATALLLMFLLLRPRGGGDASMPVASEPPPQALAPANPTTSAEVGTPASEPAAEDVRLRPVTTNYDYNDPVEAGRYYRESPDLPVAFYGLVLDQDSNALQSAKIDVDVTQWDLGALPVTDIKTTHTEVQTGADGRFQVSGLSGHTVAISGLSKNGYEPEFIRRYYGEYGPQAGSISEPVVFKMWSTNMHEELITGNKSFVVIPDGRHYGIDLIKGTIAEGDEGDLVAWIKRPDGVRRGQRYDWSCELTTPGGGLLEDSHYGMFTAPEAGYTNAFAYHEASDFHWWSGGFAGKRFYVKVRSGQMYGRIVIDLDADYHGKQPAMITFSYAVNPSGSRLLR